jgi:hypothetical protein
MSAARRLQQVSVQLLGNGPAAAVAAQPDGLTHAEAHRRSLKLMRAVAPPDQEPWRKLPQLQLTKEQLAAWETFGFLSLPSLLSDRADQIITDFEEVWDVYGGGHDGKPHEETARSCIVPFLDSHPGLCSLLDDPRILGLATGLLGDHFNLMGSDGNYYAGDTGWHSDGGHKAGDPIHIKIAFYLDELTAGASARPAVAGV